EDGVLPLRSTGPLLMLDPKASYFSREIPMESGDLVVMYTDGLAEARAGGSLFGEDRIIKAAERELAAPPDVLCKALLDAAKDHAGGIIDDDTAIMAIRRD
ncbi:MAG: PP2C family protein-serine/threonine phosphatase, partial [Acidimicrobiales bacterium]|nr:PP2C family protein-serine/threonine phosphatase [Acidimicrobiales bacterium]